MATHSVAVALRLESVDWNKLINDCFFSCASRSPLGECGLKSSVPLHHGESFDKVALRLESVDWNVLGVDLWESWKRRSPLGERGLKYHALNCFLRNTKSLSAWRAWIEIGNNRNQEIITIVALRLESVDWNTAVVGQTAEDGTVALHLESVDWNTKNFGRGTTYILSLSVWRAWIKIATIIIFARLQSAFFRLEDLDWNMFW